MPDQEQDHFTPLEDSDIHASKTDVMGSQDEDFFDSYLQSALKELGKNRCGHEGTSGPIRREVLKLEQEMT